MPDQVADVAVDFLLDRKAEVHRTDEGLTIEGYAADWLLDRMDEAFEPGAFEASIKSFMQNPILVYHHHYDQALGRVLEMENRVDGLWVKAFVDKPTPGGWAEDVYHKIERGTIRGFSVGGKWHRRAGPDGKPRIWKADMAELSITPLPVNGRTLFELAGKAFDEPCGCGDGPVPGEAEIKAMIDKLAPLTKLFDFLDGKATGEAAKRRKWAASGVALSDGSYPITHCGTDRFSNGAARSLVGNGNAAKSTIMAHIRKREAALGCSQ